MSEHWAAKPLRDLNLSGIFAHEQETVEKSKPNPYSQQRAKDGTPHTIGGLTKLRPPTAGPTLYIADDLSKATSADVPKQREAYDADAVLKSFLAQK